MRIINIYIYISSDEEMKQPKINERQKSYQVKLPHKN